MARIDTFQNWATDVADSIREKTGKSDKIPASSFDTEIKSITTNENLDEELATYDDKLDTQEISINTLVASLSNKGAGKPPKYAPRRISFYYYGGTDLNEEIANLDFKNITNTSSMFAYCNKLTSLDTSNFDISNVTTTSSMFSSCSSLTSLDVSKFNTSNVNNMSNMFSNCSNLTSIDVSNFDTSKVTNLGSMFYDCRKLTSLDLSNFNTSNVTNMYGMFYKCYGLTNLDLSNFNTNKVTSVGNMFEDCSGLMSLDIRNFDFANVTSYSGMLKNVPNDCLIIVKDETAKTWITSKFTNLTNVKTLEEV